MQTTGRPANGHVNGTAAGWQAGIEDGRAGQHRARKGRVDQSGEEDKAEQCGEEQKTEQSRYNPAAFPASERLQSSFVTRETDAD